MFSVKCVYETKYNSLRILTPHNSYYYINLIISGL